MIAEHHVHWCLTRMSCVIIELESARGATSFCGAGKSIRINHQQCADPKSWSSTSARPEAPERLPTTSLHPSSVVSVWLSPAEHDHRCPLDQRSQNSPQSPTDHKHHIERRASHHVGHRILTTPHRLCTRALPPPFAPHHLPLSGHTHSVSLWHRSDDHDVAQQRARPRHWSDRGLGSRSPLTHLPHRQRLLHCRLMGLHTTSVVNRHRLYTTRHQ